MNEYQQGFKSDITSMVFKLAGKIWLRITATNAIQTGVGFILILILFALILASKFDLAELSESFSNPAELTRTIGEVFSTIFN